MNIITVDVFVNDNFLGHVSRTPLVNSVVYNLYKPIPFPARIKNSHNTFVIVGRENDCLLMDMLGKIYLTFRNLASHI